MDRLLPAAGSQRWPCGARGSGRRGSTSRLGDYVLLASIGVASFGLAVAGVARQRRGDTRAASPRTVERRGFSDWLAGLFRFPCPTTSATRAQVWFDLKSSGLPVLAIGGALAIVIPLLFVVTTRLDVALSGVFTRPATRMVAVVVAMFSLPVLLTFGGNAFGIRARQGRTYASAFEATQACGTARMAGLKVLVRSVCLLAALVAVGTSVWTSASVIPFDVLEDNDTFIEKSRSPVSAWMRVIQVGVEAMSAHEQLALAFVAFIAVAVMVALACGAHGPSGTLSPACEHRGIAAAALWSGARAAGAGRARRQWIGCPVHGRALRGDTLDCQRRRLVLATVYLFWRSLAERLLTLRSAGVALLTWAAFAAAWVTVLRAAGVQLAGMPHRRMPCGCCRRCCCH